MPDHPPHFPSFVPQGWKTEPAGIAAPQAKPNKAPESAVEAEELGNDSIWAYDHPDTQSFRRFANTVIPAFR
jgi:hypothetical protein